jgi:hypothetical protein
MRAETATATVTSSRHLSRVERAIEAQNESLVVETNWRPRAERTKGLRQGTTMSNLQRSGNELTQLHNRVSRALLKPAPRLVICLGPKKIVEWTIQSPPWPILVPKRTSFKAAH